MSGQENPKIDYDKAEEIISFFLDLNGNIIDQYIGDMKAGKVRIVFRELGVLGDLFGFGMDLKSELNEDGEQRFRATVVSGANLGCSIVASSASVALAQALLTLTGLTGIGGLVIVLGVATGSILYSVYGEETVKNWVRETYDHWLNTRENGEEEAKFVNMDTGDSVHIYNNQLQYTIASDSNVLTYNMANQLLNEFLPQDTTTSTIKTINIVQNNQSSAYTIQSGDTVWTLANERGFSVAEILALNPWLTTQNRVSSDQSYILIKPGEEIEFPLIGNERDNTIYGTNQGETLDGQEGNDHLIAGGGDDTLIGGSGNNLLDAGAGNDALKASTSGKDVLLGGIGNDTYEIDTRNGGTFEIVDADGLGKIKIIRNKVDGSGGSETLDINGANRIANMWSHWPIWLKAAEGGTIIGDWNVNNLLSYYYFNQNTTIEGKTYEANDLRITNLFYPDWEIVIKDFHNNQDYLGINFGFNWNGNGGNPGDTWSGLPYQGTYNSNNYTPLVLDLNDDAQINSIDLNYSDTYFDMDSDNIAEKTGWIMPEDGFLAYDKDNNGKIDSIDELFGNETTNGFTELSYIDSNKDRVFDNRDDLFTQIKIWQDFNLNGKTDADELKSLAEHNIESININSLKVDIDSNGNTITDISSYKTTDGQEHTMWDIWFKNSNVETKSNPNPEIATDIEGIPLLKGWGDVVDLHLACAENAELTEFVRNLAQKTSATEIEQNFDDFLAKWTGLEKFLAQYDVVRNGIYSDCDRAWMVQTLMGETFLKDVIEDSYLKTGNEPSSYGGSYNSPIYQTFKDKFIAQFLIQTIYQEYYQGIEPTLAEGKFVIYDQQKLLDSLNSYISNSTDIEDFLLFRECVLEIKEQVVLPQNIITAIENPFIEILANYKKELLAKIYYETDRIMNGYNSEIPQFSIPQFKELEINFKTGGISIKNQDSFKEKVIAYVQSITKIFEFESLKRFISSIKNELPNDYLFNYLNNPYLYYQVAQKTYGLTNISNITGLEIDQNTGQLIINETEFKASFLAELENIDTTKKLSLLKNLINNLRTELSPEFGNLAINYLYNPYFYYQFVHKTCYGLESVPDFTGLSIDQTTGQLVINETEFKASFLEELQNIGHPYKLKFLTDFINEIKEDLSTEFSNLAVNYLNNPYLKYQNTYKSYYGTLPDFIGLSIDQSTGKLIINEAEFKASFLEKLQNAANTTKIRLIKDLINNITTELSTEVSNFTINYLNNPYLNYQLSYKSQYGTTGMPDFTSLSIDQTTGQLIINETEFKNSFLAELKNINNNTKLGLLKTFLTNINANLSTEVYNLLTKSIDNPYVVYKAAFQQKFSSEQAPVFEGLELDLATDTINIDEPKFQAAVFTHLNEIKNSYKLTLLTNLITGLENLLNNDSYAYLHNLINNPYIQYQIKYKEKYQYDLLPNFQGISIDQHTGSLVVTDEQALKTSIQAHINYIRYPEKLDILKDFIQHAQDLFSADLYNYETNLLSNPYLRLQIDCKYHYGSEFNLNFTSIKIDANTGKLNLLDENKFKQELLACMEKNSSSYNFETMFKDFLNKAGEIIPESIEKYTNNLATNPYLAYRSKYMRQYKAEAFPEFSGLAVDDNTGKLVILNETTLGTEFSNYINNLKSTSNLSLLNEFLKSASSYFSTNFYEYYLNLTDNPYIKYQTEFNYNKSRSGWYTDLSIAKFADLDFSSGKLKITDETKFKNSFIAYLKIVNNPSELNLMRSFTANAKQQLPNSVFNNLNEVAVQPYLLFKAWYNVVHKTDPDLLGFTFSYETGVLGISNETKFKQKISDYIKNIKTFSEISIFKEFLNSSNNSNYEVLLESISEILGHAYFEFKSNTGFKISFEGLDFDFENGTLAIIDSGKLITSFHNYLESFQHNELGGFRIFESFIKNIKDELPSEVFNQINTEIESKYGDYHIENEDQYVKINGTAYDEKYWNAAVRATSDADHFLIGHDGDDSLYGNKGNDVLVGGTGTDYLQGNLGNDTYIFNRGDGEDEIADNGYWKGSNDSANTLQFGPGINKEDLIFMPIGRDLYIGLKDTEDLIKIRYQLKNPDAPAIHQIRFNDGSILAAKDFFPIHKKASDNADRIYGTNRPEIIDGLAGDDILFGGGANDLILGNTGNDLLYGEHGDDIIRGGDGRDAISGDWGNDQLYGGDGADLLYGASGDDYLVGESDNDILIGGSGNDIYIFNRGTGHEVLAEKMMQFNMGLDFEDIYQGFLANLDAMQIVMGILSAFFGGGDGNDTIRFGEGIRPDHLEYSRAYGSEKTSNLIIYIKDDQGHITEDKITIKDFFEINSETGKPMFAIENLQFSDGTIIKTIDMTTLNDLVYHGTDHDDEMKLYSRNQNNDTVYAYAGNDTLSTFDGNDVLVGGKGNDILQGGKGSDTYIFNQGDGQDQIIDSGSEQNILQFGAGITPENLILTGTGENLLISFKNNNTDQIIIKGQFASYAEITPIKLFKFSDGSTFDPRKYDYGFEIKGTEAGETLYGDSLPEKIYGLGGNDKLYGNKGNDQLIGGPGNDSLRGGYGNDTYIFNRGDGQDQIYERKTEEINIIQFGPGITKEDLIFEKGTIYNIYTTDLVIKIKGTEDSITIKNYFNCTDKLENSPLKKLRFADGSEMDCAEFEQYRFLATEKADWLYGTINGETIRGEGGNDYLRSRDGDDTLIGGPGNDSLRGGYGNDTYIFNRGDGQDNIYDQGKYNNQEEFNIIQFGPGIKPDDLEYSAANIGADLVLSLKGTKDKITICGQFNHLDPGVHPIKLIRFEDGTELEQSNFEAFRWQITEQADEIYGTIDDETLNGLGGDDQIYGKDNNDTLIGGKGNDYLEGGTGQDTYIFNRGDGQDTIFEHYYYGLNIIQFGANINSTDVEYEKDHNLDLIIKIKDTEDSIRLKDYFINNDPDRFKHFELVFEDNTIIDNNEFEKYRFNATNKNDLMQGTMDGDVIDSKGGDDTLLGDYGDDILIGGTGNDTLRGHYGHDTYIFNLGDGQDIIEDIDYYANKEFNVIQFGEGIKKEDLKFDSPKRDDFLISIKGTDDHIMIKDQFCSLDAENHPIKLLKFADGTEMTQSEFEYYKYHGSDDADEMWGTSKTDTMYGYSGDDTIKAHSGDDIIYGGKGNDTINGWYGNDTYIFNLGDGQDTIEEYFGTDTIKFGPNIKASDLFFSKNNYNLEINIKNSTDKITVTNFFKRANYQIEKIEFTDSEIAIAKEDIFNRIELHGTKDDDILSGSSYDDKIYGYAGKDTLYGNEGNDVLVGGTGNDILKGGYGIDIYIFNRGDGQDVIKDSFDRDNDQNTLQFGANIKKEDLRFYADNKSLIVSIKNTDDKIKIENQFQIPGKPVVSKIKFNDGTQLIQKEFESFIWEGTNENEIINGTDFSEIIYGYGGDDTIFGYSGTNQIYGGTGNDTLYATGETVYGYTSDNNVLDGGIGNDILWGGAKSDILYGGTGNDTLKGRYGNDTYIFNLGDGQDTIEEYYGTDTIKFGVGIKKESLLISRTSSDLIIIEFKDSTDKITISKSNFSDSAYKIENFEFADGTILGYADLFQNIYLANFTDQTYTEDTEFAFQNLKVKSYSKEITIRLSLSSDSAGILSTGTIGNTRSTFANRHWQATGTADELNALLADLKFTPQAESSTNFGILLYIGDGFSTNYKNITMQGLSVNDAPVATLTQSAVREDYSLVLDVLAQASDVDGDSLTINTPGAASHGTTQLITENNVQKIKYTPNANYHGTDTFTYTINDGHGGTVSKTMTLTIKSVNDTPTITNISETVNEDHLVTFTAANFTSQFSDIDGDNLTKIKVTSLPGNGILKLSGTTVTQNQEIAVTNIPNLTFTPDAHWNGDMSFDWQGFDGEVYSNTSKVNMTIQSVNDTPTATLTTTTLNEDQTITLDVLAQTSDVDGDTLSISSYTNAQHGIVQKVLENNIYKLKYAPYTNYNGTDSFTYTISDGQGGTVTKTVTININAVNDDPVALLDQASVSEDGTITWNIADLATDLDGDSLTVQPLTNPASEIVRDNLLQASSQVQSQANVVVENNQIKYTPTANYNGTDTFEYTVSDGNGGIVTKTVSVDVQAVNDAPASASTSASTNEGEAVTIDVLSNASDIDGDALNIDSITNPVYGVAEILNDEVVYTPNDAFFGTDSLEYTVSDGNGGYVTETLNLDVLIDNITYDTSNSATFNGTSGNDNLLGGRGNDILKGKGGDDTYIFRRGDGKDTIDNYQKKWKWQSYEDDKIRFAQGISAQDLDFVKSGKNLIIYLNQDNASTSDKITVKNWFKGTSFWQKVILKKESRKLASIDFVDGSSLSKSDIESARLYKRGTNSDNTLNGTSKANRISGMGGNDRINSGKGNDIVNGGRGNDYLYDTYGNDTFIFHDGDGVDTIDNRGKTSHRNDKVQFGRNVDMNDIYFYFNSNDLYINYGDDDRIRIKNQKWNSRKIEKIELDNGYYVTDNDINRIIQDMSAFATDQGIDLTNRDEVRANSALMNVVTSAWHE
jgi:Ca2+-binding RTX toxin-like protein